MRGIVQSPFLASLFSFAIGTLFLALIAIFQGVPLLITSDVFARTPWWVLSWWFTRNAWTNSEYSAFPDFR
ncbi:DMT family transporter [Enterococcus cecorum]